MFLKHWVMYHVGHAHDNLNNYTNPSNTINTTQIFGQRPFKYCHMWAASGSTDISKNQFGLYNRTPDFAWNKLLKQKNQNLNTSNRSSIPYFYTTKTFIFTSIGALPSSNVCLCKVRLNI